MELKNGTKKLKFKNTLKQRNPVVIKKPGNLKVQDLTSSKSSNNVIFSP